MKVLLIGGVQKIDGGFASRLNARGVEVGGWWEAKARAVQSDTVLPSWCQGVVAFKTLCSHTQIDLAKELAKGAGVPVAIVDHKWARAERILEETGILPCHAPQGAEMPQADTLPDQTGNDAPQPEMEGLLTRAEVAELLGVDGSRVYQLETEGKLVCAAVGSRRRRYYHPDDVEALMSKRETLTPLQPDMPKGRVVDFDTPLLPQSPDVALERVLQAVREYSDSRVLELLAQVDDLKGRLAASQAEAAVMRDELNSFKTKLRGLLS